MTQRLVPPPNPAGPGWFGRHKVATALLAAPLALVVGLFWGAALGRTPASGPATLANPAPSGQVTVEPAAAPSALESAATAIPPEAARAHASASAQAEAKRAAEKEAAAAAAAKAAKLKAVKQKAAAEKVAQQRATAKRAAAKRAAAKRAAAACEGGVRRDWPQSELALRRPPDSGRRRRSRPGTAPRGTPLAFPSRQSTTALEAAATDPGTSKGRCRSPDPIPTIWTEMATASGATGRGLDADPASEYPARASADRARPTVISRTSGVETPPRSGTPRA